MRSIILASLVMFAANGFANSDGNPTVDEIGGTQSVGANGTVKKSGKAAKKGLKLGVEALKKIGEVVVWVPETLAENMDSNNAAVEFRDFEGGDKQTRLVWSVESKMVDFDNKYQWGATKLVLSVALDNNDNFSSDNYDSLNDIDLEIFEASIFKVLNSWAIKGLDVEWFKYSYDKNNNMVAPGSIGTTQSWDLVSAEYHDGDAWGNGGWDTALGNVKLVFGANASYGWSRQSQGDDSILSDFGADDSKEIGGSIGLELGLSNGYSVTAEGYASYEELAGNDIETMGVQATVEKAGKPVSVTVGGKNQSVNDGKTEDSMYIQGNWSFDDGHENNGEAVNPVTGKKYTDTGK